MNVAKERVELKHFICQPKSAAKYNVGGLAHV